MRIAYVTSSIALASAFDQDAFAAEDLIELHREDEMIVFIDENTAGSERVAASGVSISISPKRSLEIDGSVKTSDAIVAQSIAAIHDANPFDEIWYTPDVLTDLAWYEPSLREIRQMMVVDSATTRSGQRIWTDGDLIRSHGIRSWAASGRMGAVDGLISDVPLSTYGLRPQALPPVRPTGIPIPAESDLPPSPRLVVLVARPHDDRDLGAAIRQTAEIVELSIATTLVIVHDDLLNDGVAAGRSIWKSVPEPLRRSTIAVAMGSDGIAEGFLSHADVIVCMTPAEVAIPAVRVAAVSTPLRVLAGAQRLDGSPDSSDRGTRPTDDAVTVVVEMEQTVADALIGVPTGSTVVLHRPDHVKIAAELAGYDRVGGADVALLCEPDGIYGSVSLKLSDSVLVLGAELSVFIPEQLGEQPLDDFIRLILTPVNVDRVSLQLVPVPGITVFEAQWTLGSSGVLPVAGSALGVGPVVAMGHPAQGDLPEPQLAPRQWVETLAWQDRVRLLLPWKWGLLARAMRGRW
ncbi:MAG: hypothetical protein M3094_07180 [Actinomycetia bacterium]|nr:hypothetical protein [Actinomycetes bacterium]